MGWMSVPNVSRARVARATNMATLTGKTPWRYLSTKQQCASLGIAFTQSWRKQLAPKFVRENVCLYDTSVVMYVTVVARVWSNRATPDNEFWPGRMLQQREVHFNFPRLLSL